MSEGRLSGLRGLYGRADRIMFKAIPAQPLLMVWTPHGMVPLRARPAQGSGR